MPFADVRLAIERNHASLMDHLVENRHEVRPLHDLVRAPVDSRHHRSWQSPRDAPVVQAAVLGAIGGAAAASFSRLRPSRRPASRLRCCRRDLSVRRIHDEPRATVHRIQVLPEDLAIDGTVLGNRVGGGGVSSRNPKLLQFRRRDVLEPAALELSRPFERDAALVAVRIDARQIRIAPRGACRFPGFCLCG